MINKFDPIQTEEKEENEHQEWNKISIMKASIEDVESAI